MACYCTNQRHKAQLDHEIELAKIKSRAQSSDHDHEVENDKISHDHNHQQKDNKNNRQDNKNCEKNNADDVIINEMDNNVVLPSTPMSNKIGEIGDNDNDIDDSIPSSLEIMYRNDNDNLSDHAKCISNGNDKSDGNVITAGENEEGLAVD